MYMSEYEAPCVLQGPYGRLSRGAVDRSVENAEKGRPSIAFGCGLRWMLGSLYRARAHCAAILTPGGGDHSGKRALGKAASEQQRSLSSQFTVPGAWRNVGSLRL